MADEKQLVNEQPAETTSTTTAEDYIEAIKNLKQTTVDKTAYDALRSENKKLLESLVNGEEIQPQNKVLTEDINSLRKDILTNQSLTNLEY